MNIEVNIGCTACTGKAGVHPIFSDCSNGTFGVIIMKFF
jgi:hypothetical protein